MKCENQTSENRREFIKLASKFVREWKGHLEIFSLLQVIENSRQYLLLQSLGAPVKVTFLGNLKPRRNTKVSQNSAH